VNRSAVPDDLAAEYFRGVGGGADASSDTVQQYVCGKCGCRWIPRTSEERRLRALSGQLGPEAMRAAQTEQAKADRAAARGGGRKIPVRTWVLAAITVAMILLAIFT